MKNDRRKKAARKRCRPLCLLRSATATATHGAASTTRLEVSTGCLAAHTASAPGSAAASKTSTVELSRVGAAFFNLDLDAIDRVRVGSDSGLEASGRLEVDKRAVLPMLVASYLGWDCHSPCHG